jgi:3-hydroxyisobutyrate dehydrogenase-like beta-hydroxyacid dehydrogenase
MQGQAMFRGDYAVQGQLRYQLKDLKMASALARQYQQETPMATAAVLLHEKVK